MIEVREMKEKKEKKRQRRTRGYGTEEGEGGCRK
jgi:hypothetical protein